MFDNIPRPTCRSVYTVSDKCLRHGGAGYETLDLYPSDSPYYHMAIITYSLMPDLPPIREGRAIRPTTHL